jgi:hypothetical protein
MTTQNVPAGGPIPPADESKTQPPAPDKAKPAKRVRVIVAHLGPRNFRLGDVTDDPKLVAMLRTKRGKRLVEEVK